MNVQLSYNEILDYVKNRFKVEPTVNAVDSKTLRVMYKMNRFVPTVSIDLHIDEISKDTVALSYSCSNIVHGLINGVVGFVQDRIPREQIEISTDNKTVLVHLDKVEQLKKVFDVVVPTDINFGDSAAEISLALV